MIYFTSDQHFGHANIITYCERPWDSVEAMNQGLVDRWNERVKPEDRVHMLGDLCWGRVDKYAHYLEQLNGEKFLTPGNHDTVWEGNRTQRDKGVLASLGIQVMPSQWTFYAWPDYEFQVCHFPFQDEARHTSAYDEYLPETDGRWLLHGHVHGAWTARPERREINVGVDVWDWSPVSLEEIVEIVTG